MDELNPLIKKWGNLKVKGENLLIYDDLAIVGTSSYSAYRSEVKSKWLFRPEWKRISNIVEVSVDFGRKRIYMGDIVAMG